MVGEGLTILVVDDNQGCRDLYSIWLAERHDVETAPDGRSGLAALDDRTDLVLLDRDMPGLSGTEVAEEIEASDHDPYVAMISSMEVDFDIVESPIDDYVQKPIDRSDLDALVEQFRTQEAYHSALDELFSLMSKLGALETRYDEEELESNEKYKRLRRRVTEKRAEIDDVISTSETDWSVAFKTVDTPDEQVMQSPNA